MSKIILDSVTNLNSITTINANFDKIEQELQDKVLYRNNPVGEPNTMEKDLDMNGKDIINVNDVFSINGQWATINEVEEIRSEVEANASAVANNASLTLGYKNAAETAFNNTANLYDQFDDRYLGTKASDPSVDNDGNTLMEGAMYFRISAPKLMRIYNGTTWQDVGSITSTTTNTIDPTLYANQTEAEQGLNDTKVITPLTAKQAIAYQSVLQDGSKPMTGPLILPGNGSSALHAIPKQQLESLIQYISPIGEIKAIADLTAPDGMLLVDGKTIGSASSGATARANSDTLPLYTKLWAFTAIPIYTSSGVVTTRGVSASADFSANKRLPLFLSNGGYILRAWAPGQTVDSGRAAGSLQNAYGGTIPFSITADDGDSQTGAGKAISRIGINGVGEDVFGWGTGETRGYTATVSVDNSSFAMYNLAIPHYIRYKNLA